jgi:hypothetical protein
MRYDEHGTLPGGGAVAALDRNAVIATYRHHEQANGAVRTAIRCGLDRGCLSLVAKDRLAGDRIVIDDHTDGSVKSWGKLGVVGTSLWGPGLWGLVIGWVSVWVPGLGPLLIGGPMVSLILGSHDGAAVFGPLTPLGVGLYRIGVPKGAIRRYEEAIRRGRYLLVIQGNPDEVTRAGRLLSGTEAEVVALHAHWAAGAPRAADRPEVPKAPKVMDGSRSAGAVHSFPTLTGGSHDDSSPLSDHQRD